MIYEIFWFTVGLGLGALIYHAIAGQYFTWRIKKMSSKTKEGSKQ